jgi:tRNA pseudouridine13 synthase
MEKHHQYCPIVRELILKHKIEDFIVTEIYDLEYFLNKEKKYSNKFYYYFLLTKTNYEQLRAISKIAQTFRKKEKHITFCGRKDKNAITSQLICIENAKRILIERNVEFINNHIKDLEIKYLQEFPTKLYIGDNKKNSFKITARNINQNLKNQSKQFKNKYFMNLFGKQRFGFANNSHIIGENIIKQDYKKAIYHILNSIDKNKKNNEDIEDFVNFINQNNLNNQETIIQAIDKLPFKLDNLKPILKYLKENNQDFKGAINTLSNREKMFFINAYQSFIFNQTIQNLSFEKDDKLSLINEKENKNKKINQYENMLLDKSKITRDDFLKLELKPHERNVFVKIDDLAYEILDDDCFINAKKIIFEFSLPSGSYASNIIEQLENNGF